MKISNTQVFGFEAAIRGARHSRKSHHKSDSNFTNNYWFEPTRDLNNLIKVYEGPIIGPNDLKLLKSLVLAGDEHGKFTRYIMVWVDFRLPLYIWSELDTYKVGPITRNSESTMYQLGTRDLVYEDFEDDLPDPDLFSHLNRLSLEYRGARVIKDHIDAEKNTLSIKKRSSKWILTNFYNDIQLSKLTEYVLQRRNHQLPQWNTKERNTKYSICKWIEDLPYSKELITIEK